MGIKTCLAGLCLAVLAATVVEVPPVEAQTYTAQPDRPVNRPRARITVEPRSFHRDHARGRHAREPGVDQLDQSVTLEAVREEDRRGAAIGRCGERFERAPALGAAARVQCLGGVLLGVPLIPVVLSRRGTKRYGISPARGGRHVQTSLAAGGLPANAVVEIELTVTLA
jgi:hypothetical protein